MSHEALLALLTRSRSVLDRYLFEADGESIRDDVAEICMAIDDVLADDARVPRDEAEFKGLDLKRSAA
jgi:hypothetical protein